MKRKSINLIIFILSVISLLISLKLFWNMGVYVDEYGTSPAVVLGGEFWLSMDWLRLFILGILAVISGHELFGQQK